MASEENDLATGSQHREMLGSQAGHPGSGIAGPRVLPLEGAAVRP